MRLAGSRPWLLLALLAVWLLLSNSAAVGQGVLGTLLALAIAWLTAPFREHNPVILRGGIRRAGVLLGLLGIVLWDIVLANIRVARQVLGPPSALRPRFVIIPLALEHPYAVALLASIITLTPGTVAADISADRKRLLVHVLDAPDPQALVRAIKARYEAPLQEVF